MFTQVVERLVETIQLNFTYLWLLVLIPLFYLYTTRNHDYWKRRGVPGPKPLPYFGNALDNLLCSGVELDQRNFLKYGKIYGTFEGSKPILLVADPEIVKLVAVKDWHVFVNRGPSPSFDPIFTKNLLGLKDDKWKSVRAVMSPTFTSGKIRRMMTLMSECLKGVFDNLNVAVSNKAEIDVKSVFGAYTMDVIATCAFATKTNAHTDPNDPFITNAKDMFKINPVRFIGVGLLPLVVRKTLDIDFGHSNTRGFFKSLSYHLLKTRKESKVKRNDFLQLLIEAEKSTSNIENDIRDINEGHFTSEDKGDFERNATALLKGASGAKLTDEEAMAQMVVFLLAGYETTNTLLTYAAYCLAQNQDLQERLYQEVSMAYGNKDEITYEELNHLEYLNAIISETLRLYPPIIKLDREAGEDYTLGDTGITITKGTRVALGFYAIHHDEDNWPEPHAFKPERFLKENLSEIKPYTYLPFGAGPRNCIGMRFALAEAKLALAKVVLNFKFIATSRTKVEFTGHPVLTQCKELLLRVEKR